MDALYDRSARKKPTNVSVNADLVRRARALGVNLSRALEERLVEILAHRQRDEWLEENQQAIRSYNDRIELEGAFGDRLRRF